MDDLLNNRIVLFFIGLAVFVRIMSATEEPDDHADGHERMEFLLLLKEVQELKREVVSLREQQDKHNESLYIETRQDDDK
jgi:hypothetical protein